MGEGGYTVEGGWRVQGEYMGVCGKTEKAVSMERATGRERAAIG